MKRTPVITLSLLVMALLATALPASAHEFLIKPVQLNADKGASVPFSVISAHVFMISEEMEPLANVTVNLHQAGKATPVKLTPNPVLMTLDGRADLKAEGTAILAGHRKGMIWTKTTKGWKQASRKGLTGVIMSNKYEKFCKVLLTAGKADNDFSKVIGHKLEIVPVSDPSVLKPGDDLLVKILLDGKPASPEAVTATYDGFTPATNSYAYFTEPYGQGLARIKISAPGLWMVRTQFKVKEPSADFDSHVLRAALIFEVK